MCSASLVRLTKVPYPDENIQVQRCTKPLDVPGTSPGHPGTPSVHHVTWQITLRKERSLWDGFLLTCEHLRDVLKTSFSYPRSHCHLLSSNVLRSFSIIIYHSYCSFLTSFSNITAGCLPSAESCGNSNLTTAAGRVIIIIRTLRCVHGAVTFFLYGSVVSPYKPGWIQFLTFIVLLSSWDYVIKFF